MKIAAVSDIHGMIEKVKFPPADVLVMAGDLLANYSRVSEEQDAKKQLESLGLFNLILGTLPYRKIFVTFGNHDWCSQLYPDRTKSMIKNGTVLMDEAAEFEGVKFYGSPWQTWFHDWAWNFPRTDSWVGYPFATKIWKKIPDDTNVLVVHGPALYIRDKCMDGREVGCPVLRDRILQLKQLKLGVFGHIHHSYGKQVESGVTFLGAAACDEGYDPVNPVQVVEL